MAKHRIYWIDAFTKERFSGNPCAVVLNADQLSPQTMQIVAMELNLSETAFVFQSDRANFGARYFTPAGELPFAGHPTIAVIHALSEAGLIQSDDGEVYNTSIEVPAGVIPLSYSRTDLVSRVKMQQLRPKFLRKYSSKEIAEIFGLSPANILENAEPQTVSTGTPILMVPWTNLEILKRVQYKDPDRYLELRKKGDFIFAHHFCLQGISPLSSTFARSLGTPPNTLEDPFTGSATGCMGAFLWHHGFVSNSSFVAEQGHWMGRPGTAEIEVIGPREDISHVFVSGNAITIFSGEIEC